MRTTELQDTFTGSDGTRYYTPATAGRRLGKTSRQIDTLIHRHNEGEAAGLSWTRDPNVLERHRAPGRPPGYAVVAEDVERMRGELLSDLGVDRELAELRSTLTEVRAAWEQETLALRARVAQLEEEKRATLTALEKRLDGAVAQAEADREFLRVLRASVADA